MNVEVGSHVIFRDGESRPIDALVTKVEEDNSIDLVYPHENPELKNEFGGRKLSHVQRVRGGTENGKYCFHEPSGAGDASEPPADETPATGDQTPPASDPAPPADGAPSA